MPVLRRVAMFLHGLEEGGAQRRTLTLAACLVSRGVRVDLLVVDDRGPLRDQLPAGVNLRVVGGILARLPWVRAKRSRRVRWAIWSVARYLRRERPEVLVSAANHTALATVRAHRLAACEDIAVVLRVSNALISRDRINQQLRRESMEQALKQVDAVAAITRALASEVDLLCTSPRPEIRTVRNPVVDLDLVKRSEHSAPAWEPDGRPVIVGLGRLVAQKDFATLIRAFALLSERYQARLFILGEGPERAALHALAESLNLGERVVLPGRVADPLASLRAARLFVLSSRWEGMPGSLIEAMACACAVVSTDCPGAREALLDGKLAPLVPAGDAVALADAMGKALDQPVDTAPLVRRAHEFAFEPATDDFLAVLELARARRRDRRIENPR